MAYPVIGFRDGLISFSTILHYGQIPAEGSTQLALDIARECDVSVDHICLMLQEHENVQQRG